MKLQTVCRWCQNIGTVLVLGATVFQVTGLAMVKDKQADLARQSLEEKIGHVWNYSTQPTEEAKRKYASEAKGLFVTASKPHDSYLVDVHDAELIYNFLLVPGTFLLVFALFTGKLEKKKKNDD